MMKNSLFVLKLCFVCLLIMGATHSVHAIVIQGSSQKYVRASPSIQNSHDFYAQEDIITRTYSNKSNTPQPGKRNWRRKGSGNPPIHKSAAVEITYDDFLGHLALGQDRLVRLLIFSSGTIAMNVGADGGATGEVWDMPDLGVYQNLQTVTHTSVPVTSAPNFEAFTSEDDNGNVTNPAAAYLLSTGSFQFLDFFVSEFEGEQSGTLSNLGYATDTDDIYSFFMPQSPIPLSLNALDLDVELIGEFCAFFPGGCETGNPDEETFNLNQTFEIVASGTMNTYDGESSPGIKVQSTLVYTFFDSNGQEISTRTLRYVLWYTEAGHFVRAGLADGAPWTGSTDFDFFEYQKIDAAALPVEWLAVSAEVIKNSEVKVNWSTATESQNERFVVERSSDGERFTSIAGLDAVGNSPVRQDYTYTDEDPLEGFNYYRIQQQDFNGMDTYSSIVSALVIKTAEEEEIVVLYPNPGRNEVFFSRPADYELLTVDGQLLSSGRAEQQMDVTQLPAGTYLVRIDGGKAYRWVKR